MRTKVRCKINTQNKKKNLSECGFYGSGEHYTGNKRKRKERKIPGSCSKAEKDEDIKSNKDTNFQTDLIDS